MLPALPGEGVSAQPPVLSPPRVNVQKAHTYQPGIYFQDFLLEMHSQHCLKWGTD